MVWLRFWTPPTTYFSPCGGFVLSWHATRSFDYFLYYILILYYKKFTFRVWSFRYMFFISLFFFKADKISFMTKVSANVNEKSSYMIRQFNPNYGTSMRTRCICNYMGSLVGSSPNKGKKIQNMPTTINDRLELRKVWCGGMQHDHQQSLRLVWK